MADRRDRREPCRRCIIGADSGAFSYVPPRHFPPGGNPRPAMPVDADLVKTSGLKRFTLRYLLRFHGTATSLRGPGSRWAMSLTRHHCTVAESDRDGLVPGGRDQNVFRGPYKLRSPSRGRVLLSRGVHGPSDFYNGPRPRGMGLIAGRFGACPTTGMLHPRPLSYGI